MYSFGFFIILITQVFVISCEERESWNEERRHVHHYGHSAPDDQYVMVVEYDNCAAQDYPHRKATVTKVPFNDMHRYHRYHPTHANSKANANQMRRSLDDNSNVNTNVNTNSVRRSLDDKNSNVNTNVNTNQMRRSLD
ncbi:GSCOCG00013627001-RA-CDS, partial [Cotesia congregata]